MDQGAFHVTTLETGGQMVRNGINNLGLFTAPYTGATLARNQATTIFPEQDNPISPAGPVVDAEAMSHKKGALPLTGFIQLVDQINQSHGGRPGAIVSGRVRCKAQSGIDACCAARLRLLPSQRPPHVSMPERLYL